MTPDEDRRWELPVVPFFPVNVDRCKPSDLPEYRDARRGQFAIHGIKRVAAVIEAPVY